MRRRQPVDIREGGGGGVLIEIEKQEIRDRLLIEPAANAGIKPQAVQGIAKYECGTGMKIVKWFDTQMVARAEQMLIAGVPDCKCEIAQQMFGAAFAPHMVSVQYQLGVGCSGSYRPALGNEFVHQIEAVVDAGVGGDPHLAIEGAGLMFMLGLPRGAQHGVAETGVAADPHRLRVGAAKGQGLGQPAKQGAINGPTARPDYADDTAHGVSDSIVINAFSTSPASNSRRSLSSCAGATSYSVSSLSYAACIEADCIRTCHMRVPTAFRPR